MVLKRLGPGPALRASLRLVVVVTMPPALHDSGLQWRGSRLVALQQMQA